jgi:hypothetical protein
MLFAKFDIGFAASNSANTYIKTMGGTLDDWATGVVVSTDGYVYAVGHGYSEELTVKSDGSSNTMDVMIIKYSQSGALDFFKHYGGQNPDYATDI